MNERIVYNSSSGDDFDQPMCETIPNSKPHICPPISDALREVIEAKIVSLREQPIVESTLCWVLEVAKREAEKLGRG